MGKQIAFVTPSYRGDLERCRLLCESTTRFLPDECEHVLIIDRKDVPLFRGMQNRTVRIIVAESLLPWWIFRLPGVRRWWASLATPPIRNWLYQQLLKISCANSIDAEVVQFVDSDVTLVRPFPVERLFHGPLVRLQRVPFQGASHQTWLRTATRLLGARGEVDGARNYVGNFITWRKSVASGMIRRIEEVSGESWTRSICRFWNFSEYMTYGVYVDDVLGLEAAGHFHDATPNLHLSWDYELSTDDGIDRFFSDVSPEHIGIMIHSKDGVPVERYRARLERLWDANSRSR
jgi:hypothetical protein